MTGVTLNIVIGLLTSALSGSAVWLWERGRNTQLSRGRSRFFGTRPGETCVIVMNNQWDRPGTTSHHDVQAMIEIAVLIREMNCAVSVKSSDQFREGNDACVEFCVGGPENGSNVRTAGHLAHNLPGVTIRPFSETPDSLTIAVGGESFPWARGNQEYVLVAKFLPPAASKPVILICGQSALTNHAAAVFLRSSHRRLTRVLETTDRFCVVLRVEAIPTYGFHGTVLARDVTDAAFAHEPGVRVAPHV